MFTYILKVVAYTVIYTLAYIWKYFTHIFRITTSVWPPFLSSLRENLKTVKR